MGLAPLIGLLALGGLELGREGITDRRNAIKGRNRQRSQQRGAGEEQTPRAGILGDFGIGKEPTGGDPNRRAGSGNTRHNEAGALFYGGADLDENAFLTQRYADDQAAEAARQAMARQKVSSAASMMNAQTSRMQYNDKKALLDEQTQAAAYQKDLEKQWTLTHATDAQREDLLNEYTPNSVNAAHAQNIFDTQFGEQAYRTPAMQASVDRFGQGMLELDAATHEGVLELEQQIQTTDQMIELLENKSQLSIATSPEDKAKATAQYLSDALKFNQKYFDAKSMSDADIELFQQLAGDPLRVTNITDAELGRVRSLADTQRRKWDNTLLVNNLTAQDPARKPLIAPDTGAALVDVDPTEVDALILDAKREALGGGGAVTEAAVPPSATMGSGNVDQDAIRRELERLSGGG